MSGSRSDVISQLSQRLQNSLGVPEGLRVASPYPFAGINREASTIAMPDQEFAWVENFLRTGDGKLQALYDHGTALYTASGKTIICCAGFNIASSYYHAVFFSDGTAVQVNQDTGATTTISSVGGTFTNSATRLPATCPSGGQYLLISNNHSPNAYWIWDGAVLYQAGTLGPVVALTNSGSGYVTAPTVVATGGSGTGAAFSATVANGAVTSVSITNPGAGYLPGEQVQLAFSGGGSDTTAVLTAVLAASTVGSLRLLAGGTGYTSVPAVVFSSGAATATAVLSSTGVATVAVGGGGGSGYTGTPNVVFSGGGGIGATATATVAAGVVTAITVTSAGAGYTSAPTVSVTGGGGSGATATAALVPTSIAALTLTAGGSGYTSTPTISFTGGGGSGAQAVATLQPGAVTSVTIVNGGTGYTATPTLTFSGGGGTGATATAVITAGVITGVTVTAGGSGYTSVPGITLSTGANNAAAGTLTLMPFGISGAAIENYLSRVWLVNTYQPGATPTGGAMIASAAGSLTDFAGSDGGVGYTSRDRYLREKYYAIKQSNGYLYPVGDSSVSVVSNVQTGGSSATTTFNYQNTDPQTGLNYRDAVVDFGRTVLLTNQIGVYGLYGGAVTKISGKVDGIFEKAIFPPTAGAVVPSAAVATVFNVKTLFVLMTITDPFTGQPRNAMLMWNEKDWFVASQTVNLTFIWSQERNSDLTAWGTDGASVYQLFSTPSTALPKMLDSKMYGADLLFYLKEAKSFYVFAESNTATPATFNWYTKNGAFTVDGTTIGNQNHPADNNPYAVPIGGPGFVAGPTGDVVAPVLGFTLTSQSADFSVYLAAMTFYPVSYIGA